MRYNANVSVVVLVNLIQNFVCNGHIYSLSVIGFPQKIFLIEAFPKLQFLGKQP
jgi:hypothetical protein